MATAAKAPNPADLRATFGLEPEKALASPSCPVRARCPARP